MDHTPKHHSNAGNGENGNGARRARQVRFAAGLSGKLLGLTIVFVMIAEVLIYVPSIANFRNNWLRDRLAAAEIAALVLDAAPEQMLPTELETELLQNVGAMTVAVKRGNTRRLLAVTDMPVSIDMRVDLRTIGAVESITEAFQTLFSPDGHYILAVGQLGGNEDDFVEIVMKDTPLRAAMLRFSVNILLLSIIISVITAALVYFSLIRLLVRPMRRLTEGVLDFAQKPEDPDRVIVPSGRDDEIGVAEEELSAMQRDLQAALKQKSRLAALGMAVSKINHDLRNILASAQLISDRLGMVPDPTVQRFAPKLLSTLDRAIDFCTSTLKYGSASEAPPERRVFVLHPMVEDVRHVSGLEFKEGIHFDNLVPEDLEINADPDQLIRVITNLVRNAVQVLESESRSEAGRNVITISARREGSVVTTEVSDTGPGVPEKAKANLFEAFKGSVRPGGTGLGLAIASELVRAHGGEIRLVDGTLGATFQIIIPDPVVQLEPKRARRQSR